MTRSPLVLLTAGMLLCGACRRPAPSSIVQDHPTGLNVVFILVDTLRADHLSSYGYGRETSPKIDAFAAKSVLFTQAISQETETGPSIGSMMTALFPNELGLIDNSSVLPTGAETLAELLQRAKYRTASVTASPNSSKRTGLDRGFDSVTEVWRHLPSGVTNPRAEYVEPMAVRRFDDLVQQGGPFFLYVHFLDPHARYDPPKPFDRMFAPTKGRMQRPGLLHDGNPWGPIHYSTEHVGQITSDVALGHRTDVAYYVSQYDGAIRYADGYIGKLLDWIESSAVAAHTVIILVGDHGESLGEHATYFAHGTNVYNEQDHIPLITHVPDPHVTPLRVDEQVSGVDLMPTILELLGLHSDRELRGRSLVPATHGAHLGPEPAFTETGSLDGHSYKHSIRFKGRKLILNEDGVDDYDMTTTSASARLQPWGTLDSQKRFELYDLSSDPEELHNLYPLSRSTVGPMLMMLMDLAKPGRVLTGARPPSLDPQTEQLLRSLGYLQQ